MIAATWACAERRAFRAASSNAVRRRLSLQRLHLTPSARPGPPPPRTGCLFRHQRACARADWAPAPQKPSDDPAASPVRTPLAVESAPRGTGAAACNDHPGTACSGMAAVEAHQVQLPAPRSSRSSAACRARHRRPPPPAGLSPAQPLCEPALAAPLALARRPPQHGGPAREVARLCSAALAA